MQITRRNLLTGVAPGALLAVAGCTSTQVASFEAQWTTIVSTVQSAVAAAAGYIPTIESIANTVASLFGPTWQAAVAAGTVIVNQIITTLTNVVNNLTPPAAARMRARLRASSPAVPTVIGVTAQGVSITGYRV